MTAILSLMIVLGAGAFAIWFTKDQSEARRIENETALALEESQRTGLAVGDKPMWDPLDSESRIKKYFDDGFAENAKHITPHFRAVYWEHKGRGAGDPDAVRAAMIAACWRRDSRGQVYDRLQSYAGLAEGTKEQWKRDDERANVPGGFGTYGSNCDSAGRVR